jgi:phosphate transport system substrate-binding protein
VKTRLILGVAALALASTALSGAAFARDQIRVVGSSTVYPFTTAVAEQFGKGGQFKTPVVESTGTGGGFKLFCAGVGGDNPDVTNASRAIKKSEFENCQKAGVTEIIELKIGFDGLTVANANAGPDLKLTKTQLFLALAKDVPGPDGKLVPNPYKTWADIDPSLPAEKIEVLGPPPTSGTRDSFLELVMEKGAEKIDAMAALKKADAKAFETAWKSIREDGAYIDAGENDNLIVQKLEANSAAVGIFGYSFLEENAAKIKGAEVDGVVPTYETISTVRCSSTSRSSTSAPSPASRSSSTSLRPTRRLARTATCRPRASCRFPKPTARRRKRTPRRWPRSPRRLRRTRAGVSCGFVSE